MRVCGMRVCRSIVVWRQLQVCDTTVCGRRVEAFVTPDTSVVRTHTRQSRPDPGLSVQVKDLDFY